MCLVIRSNYFICSSENKRGKKMTIDLSIVENQTIEACLEVGRFIRYESENFDRAHIEQKNSFNNLVSYVDKESEKKLVKALSAILPGSGFLGEEGTVIKSSNDFEWIIDPLDGTTNFTHGFPPFAISVGLSRKEKMVLGIVLEITKNECFHSYEGAPAFCNEREIKVSGVKSLDAALLATGFPYYHLGRTDEYLEIIKIFLRQTHGIRRLGSAATDLAYVACGRLDGFFEYNLNPWDVAAGAFLVQQAGGTVTDFKGGNNFLHGGELCAGNAVHPEMLTIIKDNWGN
jgi:myo-inositol-1(or 4)-monophosphatase